MNTFMHLYRIGKVDVSAIGEFVEKWETATKSPLSLQDFLGMTLAEYSAWMLSGTIPQK